MILEENWAVDPGRVRAFFASLAGSDRIPGGFALDGCTVTISESEDHLFGKWPIRRSIVRFDGTEDAVNGAYRRFFLNFLSAGG